jgi:hypothetical protein
MRVFTGIGLRLAADRARKVVSALSGVPRLENFRRPEQGPGRGTFDRGDLKRTGWATAGLEGGVPVDLFAIDRLTAKNVNPFEATGRLGFGHATCGECCHVARPHGDGLTRGKRLELFREGGEPGPYLIVRSRHRLRGGYGEGEGEYTQNGPESHSHSLKELKGALVSGHVRT